MIEEKNDKRHAWSLVFVDETEVDLGGYNDK